MNLSPEQVRKFWQLWPQACRANGWTKERGLTAAQIDAKRKEVLLECGFTSLTKVDRVDGFTKVKNKLLILIGVSVQAGKEDQDPTENKGRTHRWVIEKQIIPCLALYEEDVTGYVATVLAGLTRHFKTDRPTRPPHLGDLETKPTFKRVNGRWQKGPSQMLQALMTLSARLDSHRRAAGHSVHEMKIAAGVPCDCAEICARKQFFAQVIAEPVEEEQPF